MMQRLLAIILLLMCSIASAHEVRPGYLEISATENTVDDSDLVYDVLWKMPVKGPVKLRLSVVLPDNCSERSPISSHIVDAARIDRWQVTCADGIDGGAIRIDGLENTITDVLLRLQHAGGSTETVRLTPTASSHIVQGEQAMSRVAVTYFLLGVEHILFGIDHLLFVLALLLLVRNWRRLVITVTAFTLAHSITLAMSVLGWLQVSQAPVEAVIALSIVFIASEVLHARQGREGATSRMPWIAAFVFGLLHGVGFAGALTEIGLPQHAIPLALAMFNIGVEAGQLLFITAFFITLSVQARVAGIGSRQYTDSSVSPAWLMTEKIAVPAAYLTGSLASFWLIERTLSFLP